ncbi:hypothetical protein Cgig2_029534 [Carnegiea gigantea]|uniref:Transmembrane protein 18 n=1 Tax=Carnegiea gigantea TaxID=171969 RepID=A0A9Q1KKZ7_9CARY|nr:hypothetical protein Cgig2_029534 [Carnegiea gigantea]
MEEVKTAMEEHMNLMADLVQKLSTELRSGLAPAYDNFMGFFHAIDWKNKVEQEISVECCIMLMGLCSISHVSGSSIKFPYCSLQEPWLMCLLGFHVLLLLTTIISRRHVNFQMCLFLLALSGVYLAERLNRSLGAHWQSFATQNYFDPHGLFLSVLWSGPLLIISMLILVNTLFSLCHLIVRWKRAELRHRARLSEKKEG